MAEETEELRRSSHGKRLLTLVGWLVHCGHSWTVVLARKTVDVNFKWNRSHGWPEIE